MKEFPSSALLQKKIRNTARKNRLRARDEKTSAPGAAFLLQDLKNSMTLLYLSPENLRGCLDEPGVCAKRIEDIKDPCLLMGDL